MTRQIYAELYLLVLLLVEVSLPQAQGFVATNASTKPIIKPAPIHRRFCSKSTRLFSVPAIIAPTSAQKQDFLGHQVYTEIYTPFTAPRDTRKTNVEVILIHGFGCSTTYWREPIALLQEKGYTVHALDLLGQGQSDKPGRSQGIEYSINLWARQVEDYVDKHTKKNSKIVLMGNSLGSLVAMATASGDFLGGSDDDLTTKLTKTRQRVCGVGMYNCGIGMNSRNFLQEFTGIQKVLFTAIFDLFDALIFGNLPLLTFVLGKVVSPELLKNALTGLYQYADSPEDRVDEALVDSFYQPALDPNSPECLSQIYTNDPGATPMEIYERHKDFFQSQCPIHLVWGTKDGVTPLEGSVGQFFLELSKDPPTTGVSIELLEAGHIPFDERPECNESMLRWVNSAVDAKSKTKSGKQTGGMEFKLPFLNND